MSELPELVKDLALILVVAGFVTLIFKKLKQPLVLGYIVAGFLVSPHMPYVMSVVDKSDIQTWADIGVIFLLFSLGLDFSIKKILKMGASPIIAACTIIFCMMTLGVIVGHSFGWKEMDCIFLGGMVAMSSTTIIYKAFSDMGLTQQGFASTVMSVLILEDILAIVMMVMLSTVASGNSPDGVQLLGSIMKIGFFLVLWFVVGLFAIPLFLRSVRKLLNNETLLIVALGFCCLMAVISTQVGFSAAFGAFVMGSILAETVEADKIIRLVDPVKNLFGAIFFVSVGMLVNPNVLINYAVPILLLVITILVGQALFGTLGYLLGGQTLKNAMRCGFSMAQVGEFAFIIATLGRSLGVISEFLYPVVVAVSVITTFLTPYMIRAAEPCYNFLVKHLPKQWVRRLTHIQTNSTGESATEDNLWKVLMKKIILNTLIYGILSSAVIAIMFSAALPICRNLSIKWTGSHWIGNAVCGFLTILFIAPFLRSIVMKQNHSEAFKALWTDRRINRLPLTATILARVLIALSFIFYVCNYLTRFKNALMIAVAVGLLILMLLSRWLKKRSITLERLFIQNLQSRDIEAQKQGKKKPLFANHLIDRDIHIANLELPDDSLWAGKTLHSLKLRNRFGVHISSILRGSKHINIPNGGTILFPGDKLQAIGNDEQLTKLSKAINAELQPEVTNIEKHEMKLRSFTISKTSPFIGKTLKDSGIRDEYNCMVVGVDEGQKNLTLITPSRCLQAGDILWVVGEEKNLERILALG
ncbi:cation:proton antiporter [Prevotella scopos JCM 17725]|uniref:Monovalent cation:H+ antiporter-2, CPA2 family n=1 Tax=Prevotella scopos JCM 17725 TaxID=1236518 RepID=A0AAX2F585_9BACT|nr:cation:proton antiporter [Prevotella scopos]ANR72691.1 sodium:proton antiporter [Prevotella scopos JCM 17725]QUB45090.1 cation:proton antiporter [Prevotella scopos JCM 17725]SHF94928.1 monovalent cation:H+ antiporter-2, CPA2 family [Prevotella scopos JCM 17725]